MSAHVDPIPREARPFQGHRAGLVTRTTAVAVDLGIVIIALGVTYLGVFAFLFLLDPKLHRSDAVAWVGCLLLTVYLAVSWMSTGRTYGNQVMGLRRAKISCIESTKGPPTKARDLARRRRGRKSPTPTVTKVPFARCILRSRRGSPRSRE
jgi:hypothetical protein